MHKELIICIIIIISVIVANILTQNYTKESANYFDNKLGVLRNKIEEKINSIENKDNMGIKNENKDDKKDNELNEEIKEEMKIIMEDWKTRYQTLAFFIEHDELEKVETDLTGIKASIDTEEYEEAISELEKTKFILNHIKEKFKLDIKNIF